MGEPVGRQVGENPYLKLSAVRCAVGCGMPFGAELAGRWLPMVGDRGLKLCVDYARGWRDVSGLLDLATAARKRAEIGGRAQPILEDLLSALRGDRLPTEKAMEAAFARSMSGKPARQPTTCAAPQTGRGASAMAVQPAREVSPVEALPVPQ